MKQRIVSLAATPQAVDIDLATTALLVIDMQNDFCHPNGWFAAKGIDASPVAARSMSTSCGVAASETIRCFFLGRTKLNL